MKNIKTKIIICLKYYLRICWLPMVLVIIFIVQNQLFNFWLDIFPGRYFFRLSMASAALGLILYGPGVLMGKRVRYIYLGCISIITSFLIIFQFLYYTYSGGFLQASALLYAGEGLSTLGTIKFLLTYRLVLFVMGPALVVITAVFNHRWHIAEISLLKKEKISTAVFLAVLIIFGYGSLLIEAYKETGSIIQIHQYSSLFDTNALISEIGVVNYSLGDLINFSLHTERASAADINFATSWSNDRPKTWPGAKDFGIAKGRNLIFIQVESLENSVINTKIGGQEITPELNNIIKEGLYFSNYYAQVGPGTTADAEFSVLNSLYPLPDTVAFVEYAYNHYAALPELLKGRGYSTYVLHGDVPSFWNRANIYPQLGYDGQISRGSFAVTRPVGFEDLGDADFFTESISKLQNLPRPFMATLITLSSHTPFALPPDLETLTIPKDINLNWLQEHYLQSIHYTDQAIGNFIRQLKKTDLYNNSLIVIYGDHGSSTKIGDALGVNNKVPLADLLNSQVPMIILAPQTNLLGINSSPAGHLDIYPTVVNLLGVSAPSSTLGQDLLNTKNPIFVHRNLKSGTVSSFLTSGIAYEEAADGIFGDSGCLETSNKQPLPIEDCLQIYNRETNTVKASDILIRGNLVPPIGGAFKQ